jgi:hypothetical protein
MAMNICEQGRAVLTAMSEGQLFTRASRGWESDRMMAPDRVVSDLERRNLVAMIAGGRLRLTPAGEAWHVRRAGGTRSRRLLVERSLDDGGRTQARSVTVNLGESPMSWLMARGLISERQFAAGDRLRADWTLAGLGPRVTMRWDASPTGGKGMPHDRLDPTLTQISARQRFDGALAHAGQGLSDILWRVVCAGEGLAAAESALGWPKRAGKLVLGLALDRVADFYRVG